MATQPTYVARKGYDAEFADLDVDGDLTVTGTITGDVTGDVTGNVIGGVQSAVETKANDGAIAIEPKTVFLTKGSAAAITLAVPSSGLNGTILTVIAGSAQAHVITQGTVGFNAKGSSGTITFTAAIGNAVQLIAYEGNWYTVSSRNVTVA